MGRRNESEGYVQPKTWEVGLPNGNTVDVVAHYVFNNSGANDPNFNNGDGLLFRRYIRDEKKKSNTEVTAEFAAGSWAFYRPKQ